MAVRPQFVATPNAGTPGVLTAANTALDGTGTTGRLLAFTAGASGSLLPSIRFTHKGTNSSATVMRVFRNNGADPETATNNVLIGERAVAANTLSQTAASIAYDLPLDITLEAGERIYVTMGTAATAGVHIAPINGGDF